MWNITIEPFANPESKNLGKLENIVVIFTMNFQELIIVVVWFTFDRVREPEIVRYSRKREMRREERDWKSSILQQSLYRPLSSNTLRLCLGAGTVEKKNIEWNVNNIGVLYKINL